MIIKDFNLPTRIRIKLEGIKPFVGTAIAFSTSNKAVFVLPDEEQIEGAFFYHLCKVQGMNDEIKERVCQTYGDSARGKWIRDEDIISVYNSSLEELVYQLNQEII